MNPESKTEGKLMRKLFVMLELGSAFVEIKRPISNAVTRNRIDSEMRERERGTLKQLCWSVRPFGLMLGSWRRSRSKTVMRLVFDVPIKGSLLLLRAGLEV